jgi:hypothetical protein
MVTKRDQSKRKSKKMSPRKESSDPKAKILNRPEHTRPEEAKAKANHGEGEFGCGGPRDG